LPAHGLSLIKLRGIGGDVDGATASSLDFGLYRRSRMHIAAVNRDLGAVLGEEPRDARSDPARAARDKSHFILK
jgi:hypothetical protein